MCDILSLKLGPWEDMFLEYKFDSYYREGDIEIYWSEFDTICLTVTSVSVVLSHDHWCDGDSMFDILVGTLNDNNDIDWVNNLEEYKACYRNLDYMYYQLADAEFEDETRFIKKLIKNIMVHGKSLMNVCDVMIKYGAGGLFRINRTFPSGVLCTYKFEVKK